MASLHASCASQGLQPEPSFLAKVIQLHETTLVRHGLMLVGPTMAGKTCAYRVLAQGCSALATNGVAGYDKV
jgi:dynein heavy chain